MGALPPVVTAEVAFSSKSTIPSTEVTLTRAEARHYITADALDRAWRTFKSGIGLDIAVGLALTAGTMVADLEWTPAYWTLLGTLAAKSVLQSVVSYILRKRSAPKVGVQV